MEPEIYPATETHRRSSFSQTEFEHFRLIYPKESPSLSPVSLSEETERKYISKGH